MESQEPVSGREPTGVQQPVLVQDAFTRWVYGRPFFGGLWLTLGGAWILLTMKASVKVVLHVGMQGVAGYLLPTLMVLLGLLILFSPDQRLFYSITGVLISMGTWVTSNLGGFMVGLLLGVAGSILTFGWLPDQDPWVSRRERREQAREAERPGTETGPGQPGPATDTAQAGMVSGTPRAAR
ncbi:hypothetical protein M2158_007611 [Streptomyces sp. SAI-144]|jgi:hypothetical protein|uniref:DUF6114 domain-containing protein n=1 Tax=unclassified Streptomyces TaxID=2593676 RepID=UPI002475E9B6|nr:MULTISPECIES: DUF6114 domain-containing protein [unclassified Streptomyces]MDH6439070.1 hypothetical protein [Streptomyces sp. SAI-144]MDH6486457.1 hypothetical protein [Streptomyces sp. SAI-127]